MIGAVTARPVTYYAAIAGRGATYGATPIVMPEVNRRVPFASQMLHVIVEPKISKSTLVRWSSPDGKNVIGPLDTNDSRKLGVSYDAPVSQSVAVYPRNNARGGAFIVAMVGEPVSKALSFYVRDVSGVGIGCYAFIANGQSVRIVGGFAQPSSLAEADVAVVGPGGQGIANLFHECSGENYDPKATSYRLLFRNGGRVANSKSTFAHELPYEAVDELHPLEVKAGDGHTYLMHLSPGGRSYFTGWIEEVDENGYPVGEGPSIL